MQRWPFEFKYLHNDQYQRARVGVHVVVVGVRGKVVLERATDLLDHLDVEHVDQGNADCATEDPFVDLVPVVVRLVVAVLQDDHVKVKATKGIAGLRHEHLVENLVEIFVPELLK